MRIVKGMRFRVPCETRRSVWHWTAISIFFVYIFACIVAFFTLVQPNLNHESDIRLGADSGTYFEMADFLRNGGMGVALISLGANLLGPVLIALLLKTGLLVTLFNISLFCIAIYVVGLVNAVDRWLFAVLLMLNAETLVSLITLNKEILALFSIALFAKYVYSAQRSNMLLFVILVSAFLARWQQLAITLFFLFFQRRGSLFQNRPKLALTLLTFLIAAAYPFMASEFDLSGFTAQGETGGTITTLNAMQSHFLYPVVVVPKIIMSLFGQLLSPRYFLNDYWSRDFNDLQNQFAIHLHTAAMLLLCCIAVWQRKLRLQQPLIFFIALYVIVTAITPFIQPRYQYPVYVLLCFELSRRSVPLAHVDTPQPLPVSSLSKMRWLPSAFIK